MIKLIKSVCGIKHYFAVMNNYVFFIDADNCIAKLNIYDDNKYLVSKGEFQTLANIKDEIWAFDASLMNTIIIKDNDISYLPFAVGLFTGNYIKDNIYIARIRQDNNHYFIKIDLTQKFIEKKYLSESSNIGMFKIISNDVFVSYKDNLLTCHPLSSGEEKWRIDLNVLLDAERATVYGDMFEHQGRLFFYAYEVAPRKHYIVCVCVATGEVLLKIENLGSYSLQYVDGYVYDMQGFMLYRINCDDLTVTTTDFSQHLKPINWSHHDPNKWRIANGRIYCIFQMGISSRRVRLVIIDIASQKLLYNKELKHKPARLLMELRIQDNRIYCLTDAGTLYIYEEEIAKL